MTEFILKSLDFIAQFTGGRGGIDHVVNYGIGAILFTTLLAIAILQRYHNKTDRNKWLIWGFGLGLTRELFMVLMAYAQSIGLVSPEGLHVVFPPLEHALSNLATIVIAAAFLRYLLDDVQRSKKYLFIGLGSVLLCYLATFAWWAQYIVNNPTSKFGQTWCDWLFRINASIWMFIAIIWLLGRTRGWMRNTVCLALTCFFLSEFLKLPDMALGEVYENIFTPIRHGLYLLAIPMFGYVYIREMYESLQQIQQELRQSQAVLENVFQLSNPMCVINEDHIIILANEPYYAIWGGKKRDNTTCKESRHCDLCESTQCPLQQIINGKKIITVDATRSYQEGKTQHFIVTAKPFHNADGDLVGIIKSFQDVTARKLAEQEKKEMEAQLVQSQKLEALGTLAGGIAHDFNNILFAIIGFTELAQSSAPAKGQLRDDLQRILMSANRAKELVKQILVFSRRGEKEKRPLMIQHTIEEVLRLLRASIPTTIEIQLHSDNNCGTILANSTQMHQVLMNLCTNGVQAMDEKGVLQIKLQEQELTEVEIDKLSDLEPGRYIKLAITDTGHGMDHATTKKIFDPFFTTKEVGEGTGLGLSVVHGIVQSHQGMITVVSKPGEGTTFTLFFPIVDLEPPPETEVLAPLPQGHERILFVDDEQTLVEMGRRMLEQQGYIVTVATSSNNALDIFKSAPKSFDLVITDQAMPNMSGVELAAELMKIRPNIPIILCTGYSNKISVGEVCEFGIREFCLKPLDSKRMAEIIRKVLDGSEDRHD